MKCKDCYLAGPVGRFGQSKLCRLKGRYEMNRLQDCSEAITDSDVKAARKECLEKRPESSPVPPTRGKSFLEPAKYQYEIMKIKRDILRIKLGREKLRLEKEKQSCHKNGNLVSSGIIVCYPPPDKVKKTASGMTTFLCENCGEYVLVPAEGIGKKVHWKCMACHQENCFEAAQE